MNTASVSCGVWAILAAILENQQKEHRKLAEATKDTKKGCYGKEPHSKIKHAGEILERLCPSEVSKRCVSFRQLTQWLDFAISGM